MSELKWLPQLSAGHDHALKESLDRLYRAEKIMQWMFEGDSVAYEKCVDFLAEGMGLRE